MTRAHGEGSIYRGADGRWHGSVDMGWRPDGRRHRRHVSAKTKTAVASKLLATPAASEPASGSFGVPSPECSAPPWRS